MMNDPDRSLYKLYVKQDMEIDILEQMNFKQDEITAPENPVLLEREWVRKEATSAEQTKNRVSFMHWNILADKLTGNLDKVPSQYLEWDFRWKLMQQQIDQARPDFIGLSEVDRYDQIKDYMESKGYRGYLGMKSNGISGSAIFWRADKYLCEYRQMTKFDPKSSHIFVYGKFRAVDGSRHKDLIFAEAHLKAKKDNEQERLEQVLRLVEFKRETEAFFEDQFPVIIAGDFNDEPNSDVISQVMEYDFIDAHGLKNIEYPKDIENEEEVTNYADKIENAANDYPEFTTFKYRNKEGFVKRTIDYLFISKQQAQRIEVVGELKQPKQFQLNE